MLSVKTTEHPFSFFIRDVNANNPIFIPEYSVVVLPENDLRSYAAVVNEIQARNLRTKVQQIEMEPETSFESASVVTRNMTAPIWLGLSRDMRIFELSQNTPDASVGEANIITAKFASNNVTLPELDKQAASYLYTLGRGVGAKNHLKRRLEDGVLPILNTSLQDDDVFYLSTMFVALEKSPVQQLKGTDFLVADQYSFGHTFTDAQKEQLITRVPAALNTKEETVLMHRTKVQNKGAVPRYAWFKSPRPGTSWWSKSKYKFDADKGFSVFESGQVFCISRLNGKPLPNEELALLLQPGEEAVVDFFMPHQPVSASRAEVIAGLDYESKMKEVKDFWLDTEACRKN